ncbi:hypothetical protein F0562_017890 [Nyssa sinensis]|uniref:Uncharacterized protein n=1 Tax=Nyssa sinensis TaxID=561372 RepID=A0A5J4ZBT7_9ASTE|nr:hypothetical protein F0562_017890 [Nyssa sinensis]
MKSCGPGEFMWLCNAERYEDGLGSGWNGWVRYMNSGVVFGPRAEQVAVGLRPSVADTVPIKEHEALGPESRTVHLSEPDILNRLAKPSNEVMWARGVRVAV